MFKKQPKGFSDFTTPTHPHPQEELPFRPHSPFSTDLMNAFSIRENQAISEESHEDQEPETTISAQVDIKGTLSFKNLLRIDGTFEGELLSSGKLIVGPTGTVKADINLDSAFISGKVVGDITVKTRLVLRGRAEIQGNVTAPLISIDEGVSIIGKLNVAPNAAAPSAIEEELPIDYD